MPLNVEDTELQEIVREVNTLELETSEQVARSAAHDVSVLCCNAGQLPGAATG